MSSVDRVQTARLVCEREHIDDADDLCVLMLDPQVLRTTWVAPDPPTRLHIVDRLASDIDHWQRHGFGPWILRDLHTGETVGRGGLKHTTVTGVDEIEIGWTILPSRWGQGLATELARKSVQVAFDDLELNSVIAYTSHDNAASRRVMDKAGFLLDGEITHAGRLHVLYRARRRPAPGISL